MDLKQILIEFSKNNSIDKIGFCSAEPFYDLEKILIYRRDRGYLSGFEETDLKKRIYPHMSFERAKSIVVIAESYNKSFKFKADSELRGNISISAIGEDYHLILKRKLKILADFIYELGIDFQYKIFVDTGSLVDREIAKRAGIGWQGKNGSIITDEFGSWITIGYMITDIEFEYDSYLNSKCDSCRRCIDFCPTGAIMDKYEFNSQICISYLTQKKGDIPYELSKKMGTQLYGCDICQRICPYNKNVIVKEEIANIEIAKPKLSTVLNMSNREFKNTFGRTAAGWRGKKIIQRNALIALENLKIYI